MHKFRRLGRTYDTLTHTRPYVTKGLTSGTLLAAGDAVCQAAERHVARRDGDLVPLCSTQRVARMFAWGLLCNGPTGHVWYQALDRAVQLTGARGLVVKIAADQLIYTPPLTLLYFVWQTALSRHELSLMALSDACDRGACGHAVHAPSALPFALTAHRVARVAVWPTLQVNWTYWAAVHVVTFSFIPLQYRVAFVALKNFFWGGYLSYAATQTAAPAAALREERRGRGEEATQRLTRSLSRGAGVYLRVE